MNIPRNHSFLVFAFSLVLHVAVIWLLFNDVSTDRSIKKKSEHIRAQLIDHTKTDAPKSQLSSKKPQPLPETFAAQDSPAKENALSQNMPSTQAENGVHPSAEGGVFSRRLRRSAESGGDRLRHLSESQRHELTQAQNFLLQLRHPSPDTNNEVLCNIQPPQVTCANSMTLPAALAQEWFEWVQKGLAPEKMLINKSLLEEPSQIRRQQAL